MPDRFGFNHFQNEVACIDCDARGPFSEWTEKKRQRHQLDHMKAQVEQAARDARRRAREARRLQRQAARENGLAYGKGKPDEA